LICGIDLAIKRASSYCFIGGDRAKTFTEEGDEFEIVTSVGARIVAIDAPLTPGAGMRSCEKELLKRGIRVFPTNFRFMKGLTRKGISLRARLERVGIEVIETYPTGIYRSLGLRRPRRVSEIAEVRSKLEEISGVRLESKPKSVDELDSYACALVALFKTRGLVEVLGEGDCLLYLPKIR